MEHTTDAERIEFAERQPVPCLPVPPARRRRGVVGEIRLPLAGPYAPRARLIRFPDGRLLWHVRLWEYDRPVAHVVGTETLRTFARINGLGELRRQIDELVDRATDPEGR